MPRLTDEQLRHLIRPLKGSRVEKTQGMSYLEAFDVIAHLTRIFGWEGWDKEILSCDLIREEKVSWTPQGANTSKTGFDVAYTCSMRLTLRSVDGETIKVVEDVSTGSATHQPHWADAHDLALKSAVSGALKRCAKDLGDQFGLGLYDKGSLEPTVKRSIAYDPPVTLEAPKPQESDIEPGSEFDGPTPVHESLEEHATRIGASAPPQAEMASDKQRRLIYFLLGKLDTPQDQQGIIVGEILGRTIESFSTLTKAEAHKTIEELQKREKMALRPGEEPFT